MNGSLFIAVYAAIVATAGIFWQVFLWRTERIGKLSVEIERAYWSLFKDEGITISITNHNSYDVPLKSADLKFVGERHGISASTIMEDLGLPEVIPPRSNVKWEIDKERLRKNMLTLFQARDVHVYIYTGVGHRQSASAKVKDVDRSAREFTTAFAKEPIEISYGDLVRIRATPTSSMEAYKGRIGTATEFEFDSNSQYFWVRFDDSPTVRVPVTDLELVTMYDDRLRERGRMNGMYSTWK
jgi:hypothetical protein